MSDARTAALRAAATKFLFDRIKAAKDDAAAAVMSVLDAGDRKGAILEDGSDIGTVSVTNGRKTVKVYDDAAYLAWVKDHSPQNVMESVRPAYTRSLTDHADVIDGMLVDKTTGEVIPGVEQTTGDPYVTVRQSDDQTAAFQAALEDGRVDLREVLATRLELEA